MEKKRGFEIAKGFEDKNINLPIRKTKYSAGYDIESAEDIVIPSFKKGMNPTLVKTGLKAYMQDDEVLLLYNRSSNTKKKGLILSNSVGVVDKDYYGNVDNDGHIMFAFYNIKDEDIESIDIKLLAIDGDTVIAEWTLKQNSQEYDGIYEIKFNYNLECIYFKSWEMIK